MTHAGDGQMPPEDRLIKTLLLSALIPDAEPLRGLTVSRLVALNHGTITAPIPGTETTTATDRLKRLRGTVGQLKIQEGADPIVQIELSTLDTDRIISSARGQLDNPGSRKRLVRDFILEELGIASSGTLVTQLPIEWRGLDREIEISVGNVRELGADKAMPAGDGWRVILDYPFDDEGAGRADDRAQIEAFQEGIESTQTVFWLPGTLTQDVQTKLGLLVTLEGLLVGDRLSQHSEHLAGSEREKARQILESQRAELRQAITAALAQAYGVTAASSEVIEEAGEGEVAELHTLDPAFDVRLPVGAALGDALAGLAGQMLSHQFPDHPEFGEKVTAGKLSKVWELVERATQQPGNRLDDLEKTERKLLKAIAEPLELGEAHEGPFILANTWRDRLRRAAATHKVTDPTVRQLRIWIDEPDPRGLSLGLEQLIVLSYATQENLSFRLNGGPAPVASLNQVTDDLELVKVDLPSDEEWKAARTRAADLFGITVPALASAKNLDRFGAEIRERATSAQSYAEALVASLTGTLIPTFELDPANGRIESAQEALELSQALAKGEPREVMNALATRTLHGSAAELGRTLAQAEPVAESIKRANWGVLGEALKRAKAGDDGAKAALAPLLEAAEQPEMVTPLSDVLDAAENAATAAIVVDPPPPPPPPPGVTVHSDLSVAEARVVIDQIDEPGTVQIDLTVRPSTTHDES